MKALRITSTVIMFILLTWMGLYRYYDYMILKDFTMSVYAPCNQNSEDCFIVTEESDVFFDFQYEPYKKVEISYSVMPKCLEEHTCEEFSCGELSECSTTFCSPETQEEGEVCI